MQKSQFFVMAALLLTASSIPAAIPITGAMHYTQNFNVLASTPNSSVAATAWVDDSTIPGWWLYRAGNGTSVPGYAGSSLPYRVQNPPVVVAATTGYFYSLGSSNFADRALAAVPNTSVGELSSIVVFQNTSAAPVTLSALRYTAKLRLTNSGAGTTETVFCWYRTAPSQAAALNVTVAPANSTIFPPSVATGPNGNYISGWNRLPAAEYTTTNSGYYYLYVDTPVTAYPGSMIVVPPGEFLAMRWSNINDLNTDGLMGVDDLDLTFVQGSGLLAAAFSNVSRSNNNTPRDPADDTVSCDVAVTATGQVSPQGWQLSSPVAAAGAYGSTVHLSGIPISAFSAATRSAAMHIRDSGTPSLFVEEQLAAPWCTLWGATAGEFHYSDAGTPQDLSDDSVTFSVSVDGTLTGPSYTATGGAGPAAYGSGVTVGPFPPGRELNIVFADTYDPASTVTLRVVPPANIGKVMIPGGPWSLLSIPATGTQPSWEFDSPAQGMAMSSDGTNLALLKVMSSEVLDLSSAGSVRFSAVFTASENSTGSNFEADDRFKAELIINGGTVGQQVINLVSTWDSGNGAPSTSGSGWNGPPDGFMNGYSGLNGTDVLTGAVYPNFLSDYDAHAGRDEFNPGLVSGSALLENSFPLEYTIPASANTVQLVVTGALSGTTQTEWFGLSGVSFTAGVPGAAVIGTQYFESGVQDLVIPAREPEWAVDSAARRMTFSNAGTAADVAIASDVIDLTTRGTVYFSAMLHVRETSVKSNFETYDRFRAELIIDGSTAVNLVGQYDTGNGASGVTGAPNGPPNGYINGYTGTAGGEFNSALEEYDSRRLRDEFNPGGASGSQSLDNRFPLSAVIPASANSVQLKIYAAGTDATESFVVSDVLFTTMPANADTDGDGITDREEIVMGTNPRNPASVFGITRISPHSALPGVVNASFPTITGRDYQAYYSGDLHAWIRDDSTLPVPGTGSDAMWPFALSSQRRFFKIVAGTHGEDFPPVLNP